jgi:hypothetical protein
MMIFIKATEARILGLEGPEATHDRDEYVVVELAVLLALGSEKLLDCNERTGVLPKDNFRAITSIVQDGHNAEYVSYNVEVVEIDLSDMKVSKFSHTFCINIESAEEEEGFVWPDDIDADDWS